MNDEIEKRLHTLETNVGLCLNYVRDIAQHLLSKAKIEAIEASLNGNGHDPGESIAPTEGT